MLLETADLKNPVAPLYFPLTSVGIENVTGSFKVIFENNWISYNERSHSFVALLVAE